MHRMLLGMSTSVCDSRKSTATSLPVTAAHETGAREPQPDTSTNQLLPVVKALVEPSCNLSLQDRTARTVLHIALDGRLEHIVTYLLERNAGLSAMAALLPDQWSRGYKQDVVFPRFKQRFLLLINCAPKLRGRSFSATAVN
ncbi:hypothetical protein BDR03DRAFT_250795 [Suillus americanus]|nr:hypothetical protein BDR03DRAFT_250795 [Suillus americanus]